VLSKILDSIVEAMQYLYSWLALVIKSGATPDWHTVVVAAIAIIACLGSAFLSATIAEMGGHRMTLHFICGLILPYIYPIILTFKMKRIERKEEEIEEIESGGESYTLTARLMNIKEAQEEQRKTRRKTPLPQEIEQEPQYPEEGPQEDVPAEEQPEAEPESAISGFSRRYFESMAVDSSGDRTGPFEIALKDGRVLTVRAIKGIQDELAVFELELDGNVKSIRLKYDKIESFDKK
jgi:hypothetical protein